MSERVNQSEDAEILSGALGISKKEASITRRHKIASLWGGYGFVERVFLTHQTSGSPTTVIIKCVRPPSDEDGTSHARKLKSYWAESNFYKDSRLALTFINQQEGDHCSPLSPMKVPSIPYPIQIENSNSSSFKFILSDSKVMFPRETGGFNKVDAIAVLDWMAAFHGCFWENLEDIKSLVWEEGSYWHLKTRWDEFDSIGKRFAKLKLAARPIDNAICNCPRWRTLVHGDPKSANILLSEGSNPVASLHDFQYVGSSWGSRDLAYLFCSSFNYRLFEDETLDWLLEYYHSKITSIIPGGKSSFPFEVLKDQFTLCVADYCRHMAGWGFWGNSSWACKVTDKLLDRLDGGSILNEEMYELALRREFPLFFGNLGYTNPEHEYPKCLSRSNTASSALSKAIEITGKKHFFASNFIVHVIGADLNEGTSPKKTLAIFSSFFRDLAISNYCCNVSMTLFGPHVHQDLDQIVHKTSIRLNSGADFDVILLYSCGLYHENVCTIPIELRNPHLVLLFNAGVWGYESWAPTLSLLLNNSSNTENFQILVITSYCLTEAEDDRDVIESLVEGKFEKRWLWGPELNPNKANRIRSSSGQEERHEQIENQYWQCIKL